MSPTSKIRFTAEDKAKQLSDGYLIVRGAVPEGVVNRAYDIVSSALPENERRLLVPAQLAGHEAVLGLLTQSCLHELLTHEMGPFPEVISSQVAVTPAFDDLGGSPGAHVDGSWSGDIPSLAEDIEWTTGRPKDAARYFGESDDRRGTNDGQLWIDPDRRISLGSYTTLVGVALNDQTVPGNGQLGVMKGMHESVEKVFRRARDAGDIIGPEGKGWPRIKLTRSGTPYVNGLPDEIRQRAKEAGQQAEPIEGWPWPELTPVLLRRGDAVIALHSCPHTPTPNNGPNPRMNVYFRIRRLREGSPHEGSRRVGHGVSDHPDRGYFGQFLDYPENYNPWQTSIDKLCDHWSEWDGMQDLTRHRR